MTKKLSKIISQNYLYFVVFFTGACVLIIEIIAIRILSPYFGSTIYSISSILGVILAGLSIGYYYGGLIADRSPKENIFYTIIFLSGFSLFLLHLIKLIYLAQMALFLTIKSGPVVSSIVLFLIPAVLLGLLSPFAVKLQYNKFKKVGVGTISGRVFFSSTIGSIFGSFLAGFYLIPNFGVDQIIFAISIFLVLLGAVGVLKTGSGMIFKRLFIACVVIAFTNYLFISNSKANTLYATDGVYQKISFVESNINGKDAIIMMQDANPSAGVFIDSNELAFEYTKYFELYEYLNKDAKDFLFLGGGGYNMPYALLDNEPKARIDVVEIEPMLFDLALEWFGHSKQDNLVNYVGDGRVFLLTSDNYDMIVVDVYSDLFSIPAHFVTREFFELAYQRLNDNGIFLANIIGQLDHSKKGFALSEYKTFAKVFPNNYVFAVEDPLSAKPQNIMFVGHKNSDKISFEDIEIGGEKKIVLSDHLIDMENFDLEKQIVLTDNYAPVELLNESLYSEITTQR